MPDDLLIVGVGNSLTQREVETFEAQTPLPIGEPGHCFCCGFCHYFLMPNRGMHRKPFSYRDRDNARRPNKGDDINITL